MRMVVEVAFEGDFKVVYLDSALGSVEDEADHHAATDGGKDVLVSGGGGVCGVQALGFVKFDGVGAGVGLALEAALPPYAGTPGAADGFLDLRVFQGVENLV